MKRILIALFICASILVATRALADSSDAEWIAECIEDNKNAKCTHRSRHEILYVHEQQNEQQ